MARALVETGEMQYSLLGIEGFDVTLTVMEFLDLPNNFRGVVVRRITDGPASASDLKESAETRTIDDELVDMRVDIITAIDGNPIHGMNELITYLARNTQPEQRVVLTVFRDGKDKVEIPLSLGNR